MKKDIHPKWYPNAKVICNGEVVMEVGSTKPELRVDIWSGNHPFYTGEQRIIDTAGQVERFMSRLNRYSKHQEDVEKRQEAAQKKAEKRFVKQQLAALDLNERIMQLLIDNNIVTVGDLEQKAEKDPDTLLKIEGLGEKALEEIKAKLKAARADYFS